MTLVRHTAVDSEIRHRLPELVELEQIIETYSEHLRVRVPCHIPYRDTHLPFYVLEMGSQKQDAPTLILVGGVHGVERIGCQIVLAFLQSLCHRLTWDPSLHHQLQQLKLVFIPMVNPGGMANNSRCNPQGVDLMRNAPVEAEGKVPWLVGGQRFSHHLPWYRGHRDQPMETESQAMVTAVKTVIRQAPYCISLDCHSGFGNRDRIWFPYAKTDQPWPGLADAVALTRLFEGSYQRHDIYQFEPQSTQYTTHGDLWDYLYDGYHDHLPDGHFLPLTLEMGSWNWVRKNLRHAFRFASFFNPVLPHRQQRILRRHFILFEFLMAATSTMPNWLPTAEHSQRRSWRHAHDRWYPDLREATS